jgi:uncharacterized protein (DUF427 family)
MKTLIAYYMPSSSVQLPLVRTQHSTLCEWKGTATYYSITNHESNVIVANRIWSYEAPTTSFLPIKGYLCFYAGPWDCYVDDYKVEPQPGDFYGGWVTSEIEGIVKGNQGSLDPVF